MTTATTTTDYTNTTIASTLLQLALIHWKLTGLLTWSWFAVFFPLWLTPVILFVIFVFAMTMVAFKK